MAADAFVGEREMATYNKEALSILMVLLFSEYSNVAYNIRRRWLRYPPRTDVALRKALYIIFDGILTAPLELEIGDDYLQVFACEFLRIPADTVAVPVYATLERGLRMSFARSTVERPSMHRHYADYRYNALLNGAVDRTAIACNLAHHILAFAEDVHYLHIRVELCTMAEELFHDFYAVHASKRCDMNIAMDAALAIGKLTAPHSPVIRHLKGSDDGRLVYSAPAITAGSDDTECNDVSDESRFMQCGP